jgi:serine phosphatase RsbU (regulator of sigma subunit)
VAQLSADPVRTQTDRVRLLVVGETHQWPDAVRELVANRPVETVEVRTCEEAREPSRLRDADAVLVCAGAEQGEHELSLLAEALTSRSLMAVMVTPQRRVLPEPDDDVFVDAPPDASGDELWGRLMMMREYRPILHRMEKQVDSMQRLGRKLNQQFVEVDQELRLASRLQRDFLPKVLPEVGEYHFASLFRPANWVSGDVYDVSRLDETSVGFYLADAVGHGVAAGLLTMFIKHAVVGKRITAGGYTIVPPHEVLEVLNQEIARQELPHCQFVTACYGFIDTATNTLSFARGGHPHPIHVSARGAAVEVRNVGGLLGVFPDEEFATTALELEPGEKFIIYSDGLEDTIISRREREQGHVEFSDEFQAMMRLPAQECLDALATAIDQTEGSLAPLDDMTCIIVERRPA